MAFEMICGQCRGNLLVEQFGVVVACPHCGAHLHIPAATPPAPAAPVTPPNVTPPPRPAPLPVSAPAPAPVPAPVPVPVLAPPAPHFAPPVGPVSVPQPFSAAAVSVPNTLAAISSTAASAPAVEEQLPYFGEPTAIATPEAAAPIPEPVATFVASNPMESLFGADEDTVPVAVSPAAPEPIISEPRAPVAPEITQTAIDTEEPVANFSASGLGLHDLFGGAAYAAPPESVPHDSPTGDLYQSTSQASDSAISASGTKSDSATAVKVSKPSEKDKDQVLMPKTAVLLLLSYTSAITLGFAWLFFQSLKSKESDYGLESLPDVAPLKKNVSLRLVPEREKMPAGHDLEIGDSQRFGNIKVTVVKVTRGPMQFVHFSGKPNKTRFPTAPVLKLWLKFQNVSKDQEIAPLDAHLLFAKSGKDRFTWRGNQFVCREEDKANRDKRKVLAYDHVIQGEWDLANLPLNKPLKPGESREYYVPTCENDLETLTGDLLWRIHFRKGFGPQGRGVTTVFEVHFASKDIQNENA